MIKKDKSKEIKKYQHLDDAPLPITICKGESLILEYANQEALLLVDGASEIAPGNSISLIFPEVFPNEITKQIYQECLIDGQTHKRENRSFSFRQGDKVLLFDITSLPLRDDENHMVGVISYFADVTDKVNSKNPLPRELELSSLFKNAPVGIVCYRGYEFIVDFANDKALEMWGKTLDEIQGRRVDEIFPEVKTDPTISKRHAESLAKCEKGEVHIVNEVELVFTRKGTQHHGWFNYIHEPYRNDKGKIIGMLAIAIEVTDQVLARNKLQKVTDSLEQQVKDRTRQLETANIALEQTNLELVNSQSFLKQVIDSSIEMIAVVDKNQNLINVNAAFLRNTTLRAEQVIGRAIGDVFGASLNIAGIEALNSALKGSTTNWSAYKSISRPDIYVDTHFIPLLVNDQIEGVIIMARDVSKIVKTERELQNVIRQLQDAQGLAKLGSWEWNVETGVVEWSDEMYRIYGYSHKFPVDFDKATERMRPEDAQHSKERTQNFIADAITRYKSTGERFFDIPPIEFTVFLPDGNGKQLRSSGKIELTNQGQMYRILGAIQDITEMRSTEKQLALTNTQLLEKNTLLDSILSNSSNGISVSQIIFDEGKVVDAQTILANEAAVKYSGLPKDLYLTKAATFFDPNIIASPYGQACIQTLKSGEPFITQYFLAYSSRWLELTVSRMDESRLIHIFTDVTEVKEAQLKLEQSLKDLQKSNSNLADFAYAASHDLKEPLRKFQVYTNRLKDGFNGDITESQQNFFTKLESTSSRMQSLVNDLLEYSYVSQGVAQIEQVDLNQTLKNVLEDLELEIENRQAKIIAPTLPMIPGNGRQFEQVFQNLIGNALKYSRPGLPPNIEIFYKQVNGRDVLADKPMELLSRPYHFIEISDNGIGFESEDADRIFQIFTRLHGNENYKGSGIGLSIVRKVIESHNGFVWATSEPKTGSRFKFIIPVS
jgi:PAS domain S-box-containing protein